MVLEKTIESPLDCTEIKPVNPNRNQPEYSLEKHAEAEAPILWSPDAKNRLIGKKTLMLGKIEGKRRMGRQMMRWLDSITDSVDMNLGKLQ